MKILSYFGDEQINMMQKENIDITIDFDYENLEKLEDKVYNLMMDNLDEKQDYTDIAIKWESILDIIVKIENNY